MAWGPLLLCLPRGRAVLGQQTLLSVKGQGLWAQVRGGPHPAKPRGGGGLDCGHASAAVCKTDHGWIRLTGPRSPAPGLEQPQFSN